MLEELINKLKENNETIGIVDFYTCKSLENIISRNDISKFITKIVSENVKYYDFKQLENYCKNICLETNSDYGIAFSKSNDCNINMYMVIYEKKQNYYYKYGYYGNRFDKDKKQFIEEIIKKLLMDVINKNDLDRYTLNEYEKQKVENATINLKSKEFDDIITKMTDPYCKYAVQKYREQLEQNKEKQTPKKKTILDCFKKF